MKTEFTFLSRIIKPKMSPGLDEAAVFFLFKWKAEYLKIIEWLRFKETLKTGINMQAVCVCGKKSSSGIHPLSPSC